MREYPYWWDTAPVRPGPINGHQLAGQSAKCDVAIVGAGYTGLAAARHLARTGASVVVLERDHVGAGASSRNACQVLTGLRLSPATLVRRYGARGARALFDISLDAMARLET